MLHLTSQPKLKTLKIIATVFTRGQTVKCYGKFAIPETETPINYIDDRRRYEVVEINMRDMSVEVEEISTDWEENTQPPFTQQELGRKHWPNFVLKHLQRLEIDPDRKNQASLAFIYGPVNIGQPVSTSINREGFCYNLQQNSKGKWVITNIIKWDKRKGITWVFIEPLSAQLVSIDSLFYNKEVEK